MVKQVSSKETIRANQGAHKMALDTQRGIVMEKSTEWR